MDLEIRLLLLLFLQFLLLCGRLTTRTLTFVHAEYCSDSSIFWIGLSCEWKEKIRSGGRIDSSKFYFLAKYRIL